MAIIQKCLHLTLGIIQSFSYRRFVKDMQNISHIQEKKLLETLDYLKSAYPHNHPLQSINNYQDFRSLPITHYQDWQQAISEQKNTGKVVLCPELLHFQPTSGSTHKIKWIPYNKKLTQSFDHIASVWLTDLRKQFPAIKKGKHYWSLSWLSEDLRENLNVDDSKLLSPFKRFIYQKIFAVPKEVMHTSSQELNLITTASFLVASKDLTLISVWSPTFLVGLLDCIEQNKDLICQVLRGGAWPKHFKLSFKAPQSKGQAKLLQSLTAKEDLHQLWPKLALISCWDTASSADFANKLKKYFPNTPLQGKGLWATEGVITIPLQNHFVLTYDAHFYEFLNLENQEILLAHQLKPGMMVSPILSSMNGLLRYHLADRLQVGTIFNGCPTLTFLGRENTIDLVGEKLSSDYVKTIFDELKLTDNFITMVAIKNPLKEKLPYYLILSNQNDIKEKINQRLMQSFHYRLAIELKQLGSVQIYAHNNPQKLFEKIQLTKGMILGNIKLEPLIMSPNDEFIYE